MSSCGGATPRSAVATPKYGGGCKVNQASRICYANIYPVTTKAFFQDQSYSQHLLRNGGTASVFLGVMKSRKDACPYMSSFLASISINGY